MSKLSFRAKALDASKPMPIYMADELPDLPDYSAINRAVPQMPSGMKKEEECEHHLQRAICTGLIIPTPEVSDIQDEDIHTKLYPANYKQPRQLIHMQPFAMEQDITDYDMDSEDERWLEQQRSSRHLLDLAPLKFEEMMDRLEKSSGQTVVSISDAKALLKEDDDLIIAVFDYWLNKRLKMQHPLILAVKTEQRTGTAPNNPYLAFRRRTEKMQTRKNRKNGETSYEKMLKLRRDLSRAVTLLELVKRREKTKREVVLLTLEVVEKRYIARDFSGAMAAEAAAAACAHLMQQRSGASVAGGTRPAFQPLFHNHHAHYAHHQQNQANYTQAGSSGQYTSKAILKDEVICRKERRQYKKRKHKATNGRNNTAGLGADTVGGIGGSLSSDEDGNRLCANVQSPEPIETEDDGPFAFRRNKLCTYHEALPTICGTYPWQQPSPVYPHRQDDLLNSLAEKPPPSSNVGQRQLQQQQLDKRYRYTLTSVTARSDGDEDDGEAEVLDYWRRKRRRRCIGFARRRLGRGGRVILDRASAPGHPSGLASDDFWSSLNYTIYDSTTTTTTTAQQEPSVIAPVKHEHIDHINSTAPSPMPTDHHSYTTTTNSFNINTKQLLLRRLSNSSSASVSASVDAVPNRRTSVTNASDSGVTVKVEDTGSGGVIIDGDNNAGRVTDGLSGGRMDQDEVVEFLQHIKSDWLHFRPKTPTETPPCYLLPPLSPPPPFFATDLPFALELRPISNNPTPFYPYDDEDDETPLRDDTPFVTDQYSMENVLYWGGGGDQDDSANDLLEDEPGLRDSGVWSMELGGDGDDGGRGSWKVNEEDLNEDQSSCSQPTHQTISLYADPITLNNTKHKQCGNDVDNDSANRNWNAKDTETITQLSSNTIGSSTFNVIDVNPKPIVNTRRKPISSTPLSESIRTINTYDLKPEINNVVLKREETPVVVQQSTAPASPIIASVTLQSTTSQRQISNSIQQQQQQRLQQALLKKQQLQQLQNMRVTSLVAGQQGGNGSRAAGLMWRTDRAPAVSSGGGLKVGETLVQTNGILQCNAQLDLKDVSSGVRPINNRHHTFNVNDVLEGSNIITSRSNINAVNIHGATLTLNSHSANSNSALHHHHHTHGSSQHLTTTVVSVSDSPVLPHPKVGVGGTPTTPASGGGVAGNVVVPGTAKSTTGIVQQRKNNNQQLTTVMTEVT